ncbi:hypothetical protein AMELA_G00067520 [Ameiurus melas]|uniref:Uncharacterized protein n=1 Tax=Ameiurus melas TaxID=219545 RepID=A0A7J6B5A1_AMEME|nr:hypothetical protein AMELA_G00067520 [Ameiurus melas]
MLELKKGRAAATIRGEHRQGEGVSGGSRAPAVLHAECSAGSAAHRRVLQHQPIPDTKALLFRLMLPATGLISCSCVVSDFGDLCHNLQSLPNVFSV